MKFQKGKCLHDFHINGCSLVRARSGHLPIMMSALWYLMETMQHLPERHPSPAQQELDSHWGLLLELNPKPLAFKGSC